LNGVSDYSLRELLEYFICLFIELSGLCLVSESYKNIGIGGKLMRRAAVVARSPGAGRAHDRFCVRVATGASATT